MAQNNYSSESQKSRIVILAVIVVVCSFLLIAHLFNMQILHAVTYKERATQISQRSNIVPAKRGEIYDRNADVPIVLNTDSFQLNFNPAEAPLDQIPSILAKLSFILKVPYEDLETKIPTSIYSVYQNVEIKKSVDFEIISELAERIEEFPGVTWENIPIRNYVDLGSLAHVVGYVGNITQDELQVLYNQGYEAKSIIGKSGIEKRFDSVLRGKEGISFRTVDVNGRNVFAVNSNEIAPEPGKDLVLTIDRRIQRLAEKSLGERNGSVVVLKPATGEVLAMVSFPFYDPNKFYTSEAFTEFSRLQLDPTFPFLNRAIQSAYPAGSTFKVIMSTALLNEKAVDPLRTINCTGKYEYGDRIFKDHDLNGHGQVDLAKALALSCDVYYYTAAVDWLGIDKMASYSKKFGLGEISGIDLPGEVAGLVPTPKWKERVMNYPWLGGDTVNMSIGQGYLLVSPIQMADAVAMVVNNGKIYRPHVVKSILDPITKKIVEEEKSEVIYDSNIPADVWKQVQDDMRGVITNGTPAAVMTTRAVKVAGKTGTAEDGDKGSSNHSWFVSYAPWDKPVDDSTVVVVVQVERSNTWDWWAPKAADMIFHGIFTNETYEEVVKDLRPWYLN